MRHVLSRDRREPGFSLVEVLVAVVLLSIGLLGLAGLQTAALRSGSSAATRFQASLLAYDLLDRMRANHADAIAGRYEIALDAAATGTGVAVADLSAWKAQLAAQLPEGDGAVDTTGRSSTITIEWRDIDGALTQIHVRSEL